MTQKARRKLTRQRRKFNKLSRERVGRLSLEDRHLAAFGRIRNGTVAFYRRREAERKRGRA